MQDHDGGSSVAVYIALYLFLHKYTLFIVHDYGLEGGIWKELHLSPSGAYRRPADRYDPIRHSRVTWETQRLDGN